MYIGPHEKVFIILSDFNETWIFSQIWEIHSNTNLHENPSSGSRDISRGRTEGQKEMSKLTVGFRNFANVPKKENGEGLIWDVSDEKIILKWILKYAKYVGILMVTYAVYSELRI